MPITKQDLKKIQIDTISNIHEPLNYHFNRCCELEQIYNSCNYDNWDSLTEEQRMKWTEAQKNIKFELTAYINQLGRFATFHYYEAKILKIEEPNDDVLSEVWTSLRDGGIIKELRDKWTAHRSSDGKSHKSDTDEQHFVVLSNFEGPVTFWENDKVMLHFRGNSFNLHDFHPKFLLFLNWFIAEVRIKLKTPLEKSI